jgi:hypothetical protein
VCAEFRVCTLQEICFVSTTNSNRLMLFGETVAVFVRTIQNTQIQCVVKMWSLYLTGNTLVLRYKSQPFNALWGNIRSLLWETYGQTDKLCGQNVEVVYHRNHITSPLQTPTGYCSLGKESLFVVRTIRNTMIHCVGRMKSLYITVNTLDLRYKPQPVNAVWRNSLCLLWEPYGTQWYTVWAECRV